MRYLHGKNTEFPASYYTKGLFTWSGGPQSSGVGFFCFHALGDTKQKKWYKKKRKKKEKKNESARESHWTTSLLGRRS